jgi:5-methyltetrahydrofolate--homocysteine methyltransferase
MNYREQLDRLAEQRILILDGAMGSLIQSRKLGEADYRGGEFASHPVNLSGCNDLLCLTRPEIITSIHQAYLEAGADIVSSCSFNSTALSLADYGLGERAYDISRAAAELARRAADRFSSPSRPRFAAGSMGPTSKSLSISQDLNEAPSGGEAGGRARENRIPGWDELEAAYYDNARGLVDGGVQILLIETVFDTLNAKAALFAVSRLLEERKLDIPVMISATISDASDRLLAGQTIEAFAVSVLHARPWALGLNCSLGAEKILPHLEALSACSPVLVSCYPNAGLPNSFGAYEEGPGETTGFVRTFLEKGLVNLVGGCCGTGPEHIAAIAGLAGNYAPRPIPGAARRRKTFLAGLEPLPPDQGFIDIGERTNVAGSKKFLRLVRQGSWEEAMDIAREMIDAGAGIIDVCMDDALLDGKAAMTRFLKLCQSDPEIARVPVMADSSSWEILEAALKCMQGKGIINSISLKEGEGEFLRRALLARRYGAAVVVMLFDEEGQAADYEKRIKVASRSYKLLRGAGFPPEDIVFDPNVLTIATGMAEHDRYALDFIRTCSWIREHCPETHISGGISNLSFSFRGSEAVRGAMHAVFLKHAIDAGLSMAIVNPAGLISYDEVPPELRDAAEDAVLCRGGNPPAKLLALAMSAQENPAAPDSASPAPEQAAGPQWREADPEARIAYALLKGIDTFIEKDITELKENTSALALVEGPLMRGMGEVGKRFGEGKMFLPQVIRSARVMKKAVAVLEPFMKEEKTTTRAGRIVLATVKGDVHDIGKNIAGVVMACNGYDVIDLGVMVPREKILESAENTRAAFIGLSGLISPSLEEMVRVAEEMERRHFTIPLLIGGAAASLAHTGLRIAPAYSGPVVYVRDAGETAGALHALLSPERERFLEKLDASYKEARLRHEAITQKRVFLSLEEARAKRMITRWEKNPPPEPKTKGIIQYDDYPVEKVIPHIDWEHFYRVWELNSSAKPERSGGKDPVSGLPPEKDKLRADAQAMLEKVIAKKLLTLRGVLGFFPAHSEGDDIVCLSAEFGEPGRFCFLRNQEQKAASLPNLCLADYIPPIEKIGQNENCRGWLGLFALSAGFGLEKAAAAYTEQGDDYSALLLASLADLLAEAFSEEVHARVRTELWACSPKPPAWRSIRPAFGYPACPDHHDKELCFRLLEAGERTGMTLSESAMIIPAQSVCGMYFVHPEAAYFGVGGIAGDQLADWARRKGITAEEARLRTGRI